MNDIKSVILKSGYSRNSFDRFGDDLCEEILQYLSFTDKIRFECVSKQWKTTVCERQYVLESHHYSCLNTFNLLPVDSLLSNSSQQTGNKSKNDVKISNIERVLEKYTKINRIVIKNDTRFMSIDNLLRIIIDNCKDLKEITVYDAFRDYISEKTSNDFGIKFGKTLQKIHINSPQLNHLFQHCPNIVSISGINIFYLIASDLNLPKLSEVRCIEGCGDNRNMKLFVEKYRNSIKVFHSLYRNENYFELMSNLSQLSELENLSLKCYDRNLSIDFSNGLKELAVNRKLKHLQLKFHINSSDTQLLNAINILTQLKSLRLLSTMFTNNESVELIKNCKQLTHLEVGHRIDDIFFKDIDKNLPNITVIVITSDRRRITDETFNYLANLNQLRVVRVLSDNTNITHTAICNLIEKCLHFRSYYFKKCPHNTEQTIQFLIEIAKSRPHINFIHNFGYCSIKLYSMISTTIKNHDLPVNMKMSYKKKYFDWW